MNEMGLRVGGKEDGKEEAPAAANWKRQQVRGPGREGGRREGGGTN